MALSELAKNLTADYIGSQIASVSLHSQDPGNDGSHELSGGGYQRQAPTWKPASAGNLDSDGSIVFSVPAGASVRFAGLRRADGAWLGGAAVSNPEDFNGAGTYTLSDADINLP